MRVASWRPIDEPATTFEAHLHGRDLEVAADAAAHRWHWRVVTCHGATLAEGDAPDRFAAEQAAEDEATAVHPPTSDLLERLLS